MIQIYLRVALQDLHQSVARDACQKTGNEFSPQRISQWCSTEDSSQLSWRKAKEDDVRRRDGLYEISATHAVDSRIGPRLGRVEDAQAMFGIEPMLYTLPRL